MVELLIMSLLVILSLEVNPGNKSVNPTGDTLFKLHIGEAVKSAGAHDKGS